MITFFDLLGIARSSPRPRRDIAAEMWPSAEVQPFTGDAFGNPSAFTELMTFLDGCLEFRAVRPGASGGTVGLTAELHVTSAASLSPQQLVLAKMPDFAFLLQPTLDIPAQISATRNADGGIEVAIQGLPVEIKLPPGFVRPQRTKQQVDSNDLPDVDTTAAPFDASIPDSLQIILRDFDPSSIFVRIDVRMTPAFDFVVDTRLPLTIGPCAFLELPCEALHDMQLIPSPRLQHVGEAPVEWARHNFDVVSLSDAIPGVVTFRAIDLDRKAEPLAKLIARYAATRPAPNPGEPPEQNDVEPIIEDIAFPVFTSPLPVPVHFRLGLRRVVVDDKAPAGEEYALSTAPIEIPIGDWRLKVFRFFIQTPAPGELQASGSIEAVLVAGSDPQHHWSFGIDYSDEGVLVATAIIPIDTRVHLFRILNRDVSLIGLKIGYSLFEPDPRHVKEKPAVVVPAGDVGWANRFIFLADFEITNVPDDNPFGIVKKGETDQPSIFHDVGWYLGGLSLGAFYDPDGVNVVALDRFRIEVEELGVVNATNGAAYLMLSAGIDFRIGTATKKDDPPAPGSAPPSAGGREAIERGGGVHFHRLKFRIGDQDDRAADVLLDGLSLSLRTTAISLEGFGMLSDFFVGATRIQEFGFALRVSFEALKRRFDLGIGFFYGTASGGENFTYWMFNLFIGVPIPFGPAQTENLRVLVAGNMRPRLAPVDGNPQPLRLFKWYKADGDALSLPINRALTKWERHDDSFALGAGARFNLTGTKQVSFDLFFFIHSSVDEAGFFVALECYVGEGPKPVAYGVLEIDFERGSWAAQIGINLSLENVLKKAKLPDALKRLAALTGTLFFSKNIDVIAIGQYADPATWLSVRFSWPHGWKAEIWAAMCIHHVDAPEGPRVFALSVGAKGSIDIGIGKLKLYATGTLAIGRWRNEATASGVLVRVEAGVRIRVFKIINFGAVIEVELDWLGPPAYSRQSFTFKIETPWWLPDVSVRFECHSGTPQVSRMEVASTPLVAASALPPATRAPIGVGVTSLDGSPLDPGVVFSLDQLRAAGPAIVAAEQFDALEPVPTDSRVILDFKVSLEAPVTVVPGTPPDIGLQASGDVSARYELVEIGIRRRQRFGANAGVWADLLTPETTRIDSVGDLAALFTSAVRFEWDIDVVREGKTDTRRLLINADTAYSLSTYNPEGDDVVATTFPGWPCCTGPGKPGAWHEVGFDGVPPGVRVPGSQRFTNSHSTFNWQGGLAPVVAAPHAAPAGSVPAIVQVPTRPPGPIAVASFDERAAVCELLAFWERAHSTSLIVVEAFDGLTRRGSAQFPLNAASPPIIRLTVSAGMTSILIRKLGEIEPIDGPIEIVRVRYRTVREELNVAIQSGKCLAGENRVHGSGILAWLPNRDYEITTRVRVELAHERSGAQDAVVEQKAFFRTKGLPGLNAVARVGDEIEPYVESCYPGPGAARLYRREPLAVAFSERFNILAPVSRKPSTAEEANQILEWVLAVEKVGGGMGYERVSQTSPDWVVAHRVAVPPPSRPRAPKVLTAGVFTQGERSAPSIDPLVLRYEAMMARPGGCAEPGNGLHASQVLIHAPVDPGAAGTAVPRWEPDQELRVNLRQKNAPFVDRLTFESADATAFTAASASGVPVAWTIDAGIMRVNADPPPASAQYAVFGDSDWRHVQIEVTIDPAGGEAGVAVAWLGSRSVEALLSSDGQLRLVERDGATRRQLDDPVSVTMPDGPVPLEVIQFDDRVRATIGQVSIEGPLGAIREGRLALVSLGGGRFGRLQVSGLDGWRFHARTSQYDDFEAQISSWDGVIDVRAPGTIGAASATAADLLSDTAGDIPAVMTERSDAEARQRLFEVWTAGLGLALRDHARGLSVTRWVEASATPLILLESDEPLPFSRDVHLTLLKRTQVPPPHWPPVPPIFPTDDPPAFTGLDDFLRSLEFTHDRILAPSLPAQLRGARSILRALNQHEADVFRIVPQPTDVLLAIREQHQVHWPPELGIPQAGTLVFRDAQNQPLLPPIPPLPHAAWIAVPTLVLGDANETRALILPLGGSLADGAYQLRFDLDRIRWRVAAPDATSNYRTTATIELAWS